MPNNRETYNAKVLEIMSLEKLHRKKKIPGSFLKAFVLNFAHLNESPLPPVLFRKKKKLNTPVPTPST